MKKIWLLAVFSLVVFNFGFCIKSDTVDVDESEKKTIVDSKILKKEFDHLKTMRNWV